MSYFVVNGKPKPKAPEQTPQCLDTAVCIHKYHTQRRYKYDSIVAVFDCDTWQNPNLPLQEDEERIFFCFRKVVDSIRRQEVIISLSPVRGYLSSVYGDDVLVDWRLIVLRLFHECSLALTRFWVPFDSVGFCCCLCGVSFGRIVGDNGKQRVGSTNDSHTLVDKTHRHCFYDDNDDNDESSVGFDS